MTAIDDILLAINIAMKNNEFCGIINRSTGDRLCSGMIISIKKVAIQSNVMNHDGELIPLQTLLLRLGTDSMRYIIMFDLTEHFIQFGNSE